MKRVVTKRSTAIILTATLLAAPVWAGAPWSIDWWTLDGGGQVFTFGDDWELSGTVGQWDGTSHTAASGGEWELTGGFWATAVTDSDHLFKDGLE